MLKILLSVQSSMLVGALLFGGAFASATQTKKPPTPQPAPAKKSPELVAAAIAAKRKVIERPVALTPKAAAFYQLNWGVDSFSVKAVESGQMVRFSYQVLNAAKAAPLNDKKANPSLIDQRAGVSLEIPSMENVGQLRQSSTPEAGKFYWMVFSNKGNLVKPGDLVSVQIGRFHVEGLQVQ